MLEASFPVQIAAVASKKSTKSPIPLRLNAILKKRGLSQKSAGIRASIDPSVASTRINQYATDRHEPNYQMVSSIAEVVDVPPAYFYTFDDGLADFIEAYPHFSRTARANLAKLAKQALTKSQKAQLKKGPTA